MTKKSLLLVFLIIFAAGFVLGYIWMAYDIYNGMYSVGQGKTFWQTLSPIILASGCPTPASTSGTF